MKQVTVSQPNQITLSAVSRVILLLLCLNFVTLHVYTCLETTSPGSTELVDAPEAEDEQQKPKKELKADEKILFIVEELSVFLSSTEEGLVLHHSTLASGYQRYVSPPPKA
jgi:hypothetical protein